ncbi:MAG: hypothetical protein IT422_08500 [Pirellulaceae bacterium]|nr:hypothetical protein [Pirellulaceae bacterium]
MLAWPPFHVRRLHPISMLLLGIACVGSANTLRLRGEEPPQDRQSPVSNPATVEDPLENAPDQGLATNASEPASPKPASPKPASPKPEASKAKRRGNAGRLPPYYASVVDNHQRQAIYEIRARMAREIEELEKQLDALRQSEMAEIEEVLTASQRAQIESLRATRAKTAKLKNVEPAVE